MAWGYKASTYANDGTGFSGGAGNQTVTLGAAIVSGDRIVVHVFFATISGGVAPTFTVSDNVNSGSYTEDKTATLTSGSNTARHSVFSKSCNASGTPVITVAITASVNVFGGIECAAYTGLLASDPGSDVAASSSGTGTSATSTATAATGAANELVVGLYADFGYNTTLTKDAAFTQRGKHDADGGNWQGLFEDEDSGASGSTPTATVTSSGSATWGMLAVVYKLAAGGAFDPATVPWQTDTPIAPGLAVVGF